MKIGRAAWLTDTGRRRMRNEDAYVFETPLFAIADGMGGARAGEVAAGIASAALRDGRRDVVDEESLEASIEEANRRVWERSVADPSTAGMGTTVTVALVDAPASQIVFGHVGDSRAYRLRGDVLEQITTDHSLVAELVESGVLTPEEAETASTALGDHPGSRHRERDRGRRLHGSRLRPATSSSSARTASRTCSPRTRSRRRSSRPTVTRRPLRSARRGRERPRGRGQHHGRPLRARRRRAGPVILRGRAASRTTRKPRRPKTATSTSAVTAPARAAASRR